MAEIILEILFDLGLNQVLRFQNSLVDRIEELEKHVNIKRTVEKFVLVLLAEARNEKLFF